MGKKLWRVLFYLIRISFGILLIVSIALVYLAIVMIIIAASASRGMATKVLAMVGTCPIFGLDPISFGSSIPITTIVPTIGNGPTPMKSLP